MTSQVKNKMRNVKADPVLIAAEVKKKLIDKAIKQVEIARACGTYPSTVSLVINRVIKSRRIEEYISEILNIAYSELWPDRDAD